MSSDTEFAGSIPGLYDRYLGPMLFEPYAQEAAKRAQSFAPQRILETAAGTGIVTAALHRALPEASILATDLNQAMLDVAAQQFSSDHVTFQQADAQSLPLQDDWFDLVVCQFGIMFMPDKVGANREAYRVLREGGRYMLIIWNDMDHNPGSQAMSNAVAGLFPDDPPRFMERTPFGYSDRAAIESDLVVAGFKDIAFETVERRSRLASARDAATGMCTGSPLRTEIEERDPNMLDKAVDAAAQALSKWEGPNGLDVAMSAHIVTAIK